VRTTPFLLAGSGGGSKKKRTCPARKVGKIVKKGIARPLWEKRSVIKKEGECGQLPDRGRMTIAGNPSESQGGERGSEKTGGGGDKFTRIGRRD